MINLTDSELKVLKALAFNHYGDGYCTWSWATNESVHPSGIKGKELSGVIGSLAKKGLVSNDGEAITTTSIGVAEMQHREWLK